MGWNKAGERLLVTVDGRQPDISVGMTLAEAAELLLALGATDGINLDGGGIDHVRRRRDGGEHAE